MSRLLANIGTAVIICSQIERILGLMLVAERTREAPDDDIRFVDQHAVVRSQVLETLKNQLTQAKVTYLDFAKLTTVIEKRNWLVHRLVYDPRFTASCDANGSDDFLDVVIFFLDYYLEIKDAFHKRSAELGSGEEWDHSFDHLVKEFEQRIQKRSEELKGNRKKKKS